MSFDEDVIDPESMEEALAEAMGQEIQDEVLILPLLVKNKGSDSPVKIKIRYRPVSIGRSLAHDHGDPIAKDVRRPKYDYFKTTDELLEKMNSLALRNIKIVNDIGKDGEPIKEFSISKGELRISMIGPGEFSRLRDACFPPKSDELPDSEDESGKNGRKGGKGMRRGQPAPSVAE